MVNLETLSVADEALVAAPLKDAFAPDCE